jgi:aspartyl-tRNA(Asn)/glutamyl-tRNA(Gln) amidotransferase subunit A
MLKEAGALIFSKTNCDEFAMGSSNETSAYGPVKNPWNVSCVPGGSSGGSAAAVAADLVPLALGSDTGGSIRQPASFCGIVGLKPTYGRVSRYGLVAYASSLDQIGPMARTVGDVELCYRVIAKDDERDATCSSVIIEKQVDRPLKIGVINEFLGDGIANDVKENFSEVIRTYRALGAKVETVSLPNLPLSLAAYYVIATAEASSNLARFDGVRYGVRNAKADASLYDMYAQTRDRGFGSEVKKRILLGTFALSSGYYDAYYGKANVVRELVAKDFTTAFNDYDLLIGPTSPTTAFKIGEKISDPLAMYQSDICTIGVNLAGLPAMSMPCGFDSNGMPIGLQIIAPKFAEDLLFKGAYLYEHATNWNRYTPPAGV